MPRLWTETVETHRQEVREAILDAAWSLVTDHGLLNVTMSQIANEAGIGRATLYKYFPDVESVLVAWHERHVAEHMAHLAELRDQGGDPEQRLRAVLSAYAGICFQRGRHGDELGALLHQHEHVTGAEKKLLQLFQDLLDEVAAVRRLRTDVAPIELANYSLHALAAASTLSAQGSVDRLVAVTLSAMLVTSSTGV